MRRRTVIMVVLALVAAAFVAAVAVAARGVEHDIERRARRVVAEAGLTGTLQVHADGRDVVVTGAVADDVDLATVVSSLARLDGVTGVAVRTTSPTSPPPTPTPAPIPAPAATAPPAPTPSPTPTPTPAPPATPTPTPPLPTGPPPGIGR